MLCVQKMVDGILNRYIFTVFSYRFAILHRISVCLFIWFYNGLFFYKVYVSQSTLSSQSISKLKDTSSPKLLLAYWDPCDIGGDLFSVEYSSLVKADWFCFVLFLLMSPSVSLSCFIHVVSSQVHNIIYPDYVGLHKYLICIVPTEPSFEIICKIMLPALVTAQITSKPFSNVSSPWGWKAVSFDRLSSSPDDTELLLMYKTLLCYKLQWYRWTRMNVSLLRNPPSTLYGIMLLLSLGIQLFMVLQTSVSFSCIFFIHRKRTT